MGCGVYPTKLNRGLALPLFSLCLAFALPCLASGWIPIGARSRFPVCCRWEAFTAQESQGRGEGQKAGGQASNANPRSGEFHPRPLLVPKFCMICISGGDQKSLCCSLAVRLPHWVLGSTSTYTRDGTIWGSWSLGGLFLVCLLHYVPSTSQGVCLTGRCEPQHQPRHSRFFGGVYSTTLISSCDLTCFSRCALGVRVQ